MALKGRARAVKAMKLADLKVAAARRALEMAALKKLEAIKRQAAEAKRRAAEAKRRAEEARK